METYPKSRGLITGPRPGGIGPVARLLLFLLGFGCLGACSPAPSVSDELEAGKAACNEHAKAVLSVSDITDTHEPGSGYISVKATMLAKTDLVISGGGWITSVGPGTVSFDSELQRTELKAGQPREVLMHLVANPEYPGIPPLTADGPYYFTEIAAYVYDGARTEHWATWAGEISCKVVIIKKLTTGPYKASDFGREKWTGKSASTFKSDAAVPPMTL